MVMIGKRLEIASSSPATHNDKMPAVLLGIIGKYLGRRKTKQPDKDSLFVQKHKSVLDKLS